MEQDVTIAELAAEYRRVLLAMHQRRISGGGSTQEWNRLVDEMQLLHLRLRESAEGRDAITALIEDECLTVRQWSATNALAWSPEPARAELEREAGGEDAGAFEARITLREFDSDRLDTAWLPKS